MLNFSENCNLLQQQLSDDINSRDNKDRKLLNDTRENATICKECYLSAVNFATNFNRFLEAILEQEREKIQNDLGNKNYFIEDSNDPEEVTLTFAKFFYEFGKFPGSSPTEPIIVPHGEAPPFVESRDIISSGSIYAKCNSSDSRGLVSAQFLAF